MSKLTQSLESQSARGSVVAYMALKLIARLPLERRGGKRINAGRLRRFPCEHGLLRCKQCAGKKQLAACYRNGEKGFRGIRPEDPRGTPLNERSGYIRGLIADRVGIDRDKITPPLIEATRTLLKVKRLIRKELKNENS